MTGIILAGGKSSRMGQDKGLMLLSGKPLISYVIDAASAITSDLIIVTNNEGYKTFGYPLVKDLYKEKGPLAGIYTGLINSKSHTNIVLSCDTPYVSPDLLNHLIEVHADFDVTVPQHDGYTEQLIGVYSKNCLPIFKSQIEAEQLKIKAAYRDLNCQEITIDDNREFFNPRLFLNINSKDDFANLNHIG